jgi:hypothetical protein
MKFFISYRDCSHPRYNKRVSEDMEIVYKGS